MRGDGSDAVDRSPQTIGIDRLVDESTGIGHRPLERGGGRCDGAAGDENDAAGLSGIGGDEAGVLYDVLERPLDPPSRVRPEAARLDAARGRPLERHRQARAFYLAEWLRKKTVRSYGIWGAGKTGLRLARDASLLANLKERLRHQRNSSRLFNSLQFTRDLERAFTAMQRRKGAGLPPESFTLALE